MRQRLRSHLTYANVMATLAVFLVVTGGTAVALQNSNTVFTDDIANDNFNSPTQGQGGLTAPDLRANSVGASEVANESLTTSDIKNFSLGNGDFLAGSVDTRVATNNGLRGADIQDASLTGADIRDQSGVDTCTHGSARFGELCVGVANSHMNWEDAQHFCAGLGLRVPSFGEALAVAKNYNLPNVDQSELFWTEERWHTESVGHRVLVVDDAAITTVVAPANTTADTKEAVCVTTPTN